MPLSVSRLNFSPLYSKQVSAHWIHSWICYFVYIHGFVTLCIHGFVTLCTHTMLSKNIEALQVSLLYWYKEEGKHQSLKLSHMEKHFFQSLAYGLNCPLYN